ncbi:MAG: amidase [Chloroflexota bacterium]
MENLIFASVTAIAQAIRAKEVSSVEVVQAYLQRIEAVNPKLNAVVQLSAETALEQAHQADAALAQGEVAGPLHGVPMTIKDSFDTAGVVSTWGTPGRASTIPDQDATIVARLKTAGAILMGKTNTPEFTLSFETDNPVYGRTNNPYNLDRTSGGSSGGAAAIIAAGGSPFDIGTDTGGSVRVPAHFCGIAGIRPTSGRVPRTGHAIGPGSLIDSFTTVGPLARYVEDLVLLLPLIAGPDGRDPSIAPVPLNNPNNVTLKELRGTFHTDNGIQTPTPENTEAVQSSVKALTKVGITFEEKRPPGIEGARKLVGELFAGWHGGAWFRLLLERTGTSLAQSSLQDLETDRVATPDEVVRLIDRWDQFRTGMLAFMDNYDVMIAPVNANPAIPHGTLQEHDKGFSYTSTYNLTGWPGAVVRAGTSPEGLPIGVQIIARPWREDMALAVARHLEDVFGGWQRPPI